MVVDPGVTQETVRLDFDLEFNTVPCADMSFSQEVIRGTVHSHTDNGNITFTPIESGCQIHGYIITDKVGGNFRFKVNSASDSLMNDLLLQQFGQFQRGVRPTDPDLSHSISRLSFHQVEDDNIDSPHFDHPVFKLATKTALSGSATSVEKGIGLYHYNLNIVPTQKKKKNRVVLSRLDKMSVTERAVKMEDLTRGISLSGTLVRDFVGIIVTYDFYPVVIQIEEKKESLADFITSLCAIVGGVLTIVSLVNRCLYSSAKALIGKKD